MCVCVGVRGCARRNVPICALTLRDALAEACAQRDALEVRAVRVAVALKVLLQYVDLQ